MSGLEQKRPPREPFRVPEWDELCAMHEKLERRCPRAKITRITEDVRRAVRNKTVHLLGDHKLTQSNYVEPLKRLLLAEEYHEAIEMRKYDKFDWYVQTVKVGNSLVGQVKLRGLSEGQPSLIPTDFVIVEVGGFFEALEILSIKGDEIRFKRPSYHLRYLHQDRKNRFNIAFVQSGLMYEKCHEGLGRLFDLNIRRMLFDFEKEDEMEEKINVDLTDVEGKLEARLSECNNSQRQAIIGILEAKCRPKPYILFGPPGTGKTFTVVETVVQIYRRSPMARILVCANSNNCAEQLAAAIQATEMVRSVRRLCSQSYLKSITGSPLESTTHIKSSGLSEEKHGPLNYRVIVTTNNMAWALFRFRFDYVIIDEAGHAHEPESLMPAGCLASNGCLVLAGDPRQLGPVVHCKQVEDQGLGQSMLERLFELDIYKHDLENGYDKQYITQLKTCYRCDPRILVPCNKLFYHEQLQCLGQTPPSLLTKLNLSHPLVFHEIKGGEVKIDSSTSRKNPTEAAECANKVIELLKIGLQPKDIGVISFYTLQKKEIQRKLKEAIKMSLRDIYEAWKELDVRDLDYLEIDEQSWRNQSYESLRQEDRDLIASFEESSVDGNTCVSVANERRRNYTSLLDDYEDDKRRRKEEAFLKKWLCQVDTVDGFQGREKKVIIISTVRCPHDTVTINNCGFLADSKRFNVAISRAKWLAMVVGHPAVLDCHENWREFKSHAVRCRESGQSET